MGVEGVMLYALIADLCLIWLPRTATSSKMVSTALRIWPWSTVTVACSWTAFVSSSNVMPLGLPAAFQDAQPARSARMLSHVATDAALLVLNRIFVRVIQDYCR